MRIGRDLGLVVLVFVFGIGFLIRRKWQKAAARSEEIKRLLILTSEEAATAEIEGYFYTTNSPPTPSVPALYHCAVCFSPTNTRCAKCKAVRYCSGRCQILHWRQGHKDECRSYVAVKPIKDVSGSSSKQGDVKSSNDSLPDENQPEIGSFFKSTSESSSEEYSTFSTPARSSIETSTGRSEDFDWMDSHQFADVKLEPQTVVSPSRKSNSSEKIHQTVVSPARKSYGSEKINQNKSNLSDEDIHPRLSTSSSLADGSYGSEKINQNKSNLSDEDIHPRLSTSSSLADGSNGYSFSRPSDFWSGTVHFKKSSIDELQPSGFNEKKGVTLTSTILDNSTPNGLGSKKSNDKTDGLKSMRPPKYTSEMLKHRDVVTDSILPQSIFKESKISSTGVEEHPPIIDSKAFGDTPFAIPEKSNNVLKNKSIASPAFKSTSRLASQCAKPVTVLEEKKNVATTSNSKLTENSASTRNGLKIMPSKLTHQCSPRAESEMAHKYSCKGLFSYKMFVKLYNWKQVELRPFGLINCGNSCYANAVLQCLTYTPALNAYLYQGLHSKACDKRSWCFTCEFEDLVLKAKNGNSPLSPVRIFSQIENIGSNLGHGREEDAHEFLRYAIDTLQSVCLKESGMNTFNSKEEETTLIGLTFGGYLRSKIQCMKCGGKSERHERMMDLTVEIEGDIRTLEEALNKFTCTEILDGENKYKCSRCKSYERAKKKLTLLEAPNVLTIALKRFQSGKFGKLNKSVHFPEVLDMAPYVSGTSDKSPVYGLYGVVVHVDIMNAAFSGHYVCYVKNFENRWFKIDDTIVKEVDVQSVLTKGAYMLLYSRCSPRAPRLIRSLLWPQHQHDPKKHRVATLSTEPWGVKHDDHLAVCHRTLEEESSSSSDGSAIFSETCSCSTVSSHSDISCDWEHEYNSTNTPWRRNMHLNSSDSDTSSSSSSFSSPLYSRRSLLKEQSRSYKVGPGVLYHDHDDDQCRKLSYSNSWREVNVDRLGGRPTNPLKRSE